MGFYLANVQITRGQGNVTRSILAKHRDFSRPGIENQVAKIGTSIVQKQYDSSRTNKGL